ncbi:integumentary mucin B.1-like [Ascaphus truei]|uniref:integumentary mucin B.1-like n=1 Tax=Ascaphus truei TaxID=8439 RepID=UPI003F59AA4F
MLESNASGTVLSSPGEEGVTTVAPVEGVTTVAPVEGVTTVAPVEGVTTVAPVEVVTAAPGKGTTAPGEATTTEYVSPGPGPVMPALPTLDLSKFTTLPVQSTTGKIEVSGTTGIIVTYTTETTESEITEPITTAPPACYGQYGERLNPGDTWNSSCEACICNSVSGMSECAPRQCEKEIICEEDEKRVLLQPGGSCCGYCEPLTCRHNGTEYAIGHSFRDPANPCVMYTCKTSGLAVIVDQCPTQTYCKKASRKYDAVGCCYTCDTTCKPNPVVVEIEVTYATSLQQKKTTNCKAKVPMAKCIGECKNSLRYDYGIHRVVHEFSCCKEDKFETRTAELSCENGEKKKYTFQYTTTCTCFPCYSTAQH